jgi:PAS domain S-box-containing protein
MRTSLNTSSVGLLITGVFASGLYMILEAVDPHGISVTAWLNIGIILSVSILSQVLINRAERAKLDLEVINQTLEEKVRERTAALEEANKLLGEEVAIRTLTEEFLRESEDKYRAIFENTGTATIIINEDKTIGLANNEFVSLSGYSVDELTGSRYWTDFFTEEAVHRILEYHRQSFTDAEASLRNLESVFIDRGNRERPVLLTVARIKGTDQCLASISDISPLREAQAQIEARDREVAARSTTVVRRGRGEGTEPAGEESTLRAAMARHGIVTYYQPFIRCVTKKIVGFEALARWKHPHEGVVSPELFLAKAEETGILADLDRQVLNQACRQIRKWQDLARTAEPLVMSVNVSPALMTAAGFDRELMDMLVESSVEPASLILEVRTQVLDGPAQGIYEAMERLARVGVRLHLDNCMVPPPNGRLTSLPVESIKIGRDLVTRMAAVNDEAHRLVAQIVSKCLSGGKQVIAVGVETVAQHVMLSDLKCPFAQGFLYGKPMERQVIDRVIEGRKKGAK